MRPNTTWAQTFRKIGLELLTFLSNTGYRAALPRMFSDEAEKLQLQVLDFCMSILGAEHTSTMDIMLLLSRTYQPTRGDEAADLQQRALDVCIKVRGQNDLKTLRVMDILGSSR